MATTNNPAFSRNVAFNDDPTPEQLQALFNRPSSTAGGVMTVEDTVAKTGVTFAVTVVAAVLSWVLVSGQPALGGLIILGAGIAGFVLSLVNIFKRTPSAPLVLAYGAAQGLFLGAISLAYESSFPGIITQALLATFAVFGVTLALFANGKIRASARATKIFLIAMVGYLAYSVINMFIVMFGGAGGNPWGLDGNIELFGIPLGVIVGVLVTIMAAYSLVLDFDSIQQGVRNQAPAVFGWSAAFGIMVTMIWLYLNILRTLAIVRQD
ncbi:MAG TPA: Bax inhibitor-1/YccA family protein [Microbacteriaceae bacterium]|nr:Bax inhibitor-1/YccA family protein [Microbacteriaceae bacterium]